MIVIGQSHLGGTAEAMIRRHQEDVGGRTLGLLELDQLSSLAGCLPT
jgi:hypothetical protein